MSFKRIIAAVLSAATIVTAAFTFSGCADTSYAAKIDGTQISAGLYIYNELNSLADAASDLTTEQPDLDTSAEGFDFFAQTVAGVSFSQHVKDLTLIACKRYVAVENKFAEIGLTLSEADLDEVNKTVNNVWDTENMYAQAYYGTKTYGEYYEGKGIAKASYKLYVMNAKKEQKLFDSIYAEGGTNAVPQEDVNKYIAETYALGRYISVTLKDTDGNVIEDADKLAELEKLAQGYCDEINGGKAFGEVYNEYQEYTGAEKTDITDDTIFDHVFLVNATNPSEAFVKNLFTLENDKAVVYKADTYYYVVVRYDITKNEKYVSDYTTLALEGLRGSEFDAMVAGLYTDYSVELNDNAVNRYSPESMNG